MPSVAAIEQEGTELTVSFVGQSETRIARVASESINVYAEVCAAAGAEIGSCPISYVVHQPSEAGSVVTLLITALLPVLLIGGFIYFMMRGAARRGPPT
jgi:hypothetical protein